MAWSPSKTLQAWLEVGLSSLQRLGAGLLVGIGIFVLLPATASIDTRVLASWDLGVISYLILDWLVIMNLGAPATRDHARTQHQSRYAVFLLVVGTACASVVAIGFMSGSLVTLTFWAKTLHLLLSITALISAWLLLHTVFAFRYAHYFYLAADDGGLQFPNDSDPDYLDFAYYSLVIGMTSQVSDVSVTSRAMRRLTLLHSILAFVFNMALLALSINILASAL